MVIDKIECKLLFFIQYITMELNDYITTSKDDGYLRICALNMRNQNNDEIFDEQFAQLGKIQPDVIMLSEYKHKYSEDEIYELFKQRTDYETIDSGVSFRNVLSERCKLLGAKYVTAKRSTSHCGNIILLIKKDILYNPNVTKENVIESLVDAGYSIISVKTKFGPMIFGAVHLSPSKPGYDDRESQMISIMKFVNKYNYPCVIAGDFNMRDVENNVILNLGFNDAYLDETDRDEIIYNTWPNTLCRTDRKCASITNEFRFDRVIYKHCTSKNYSVINTYNSDHLMVACDIKPKITPDKTLSSKRTAPSNNRDKYNLFQLAGKNTKINLYDHGGILGKILDKIENAGVDVNDICVLYSDYSLLDKIKQIIDPFIKILNVNTINYNNITDYCITVDIPWYDFDNTCLRALRSVNKELHMICRINDTNCAQLIKLLSFAQYHGNMNVEKFYRMPITQTIKCDPKGKMLYVDTETSSKFVSNGHEESSLLKYRDFRIMSICFGLFDSFNSFDPNKLIYTLISHTIDYTPDDEALEVNKLSKELCNKDGVSILQCGIIEALQNTKTIVAYNVSFDYNAIVLELLRYGVNVDKIDKKCAMQMARKKLGLKKGYGLANVCKVLDVETSDLIAHNAKDDVIMMGRILQKVS